MVGLPGTGLGGVFYALLVLWMAARECWLALLGASNRHRWIKIGSLSAILGSILVALWLEGWLIKAGLEAFSTPRMEISVPVAEIPAAASMLVAEAPAAIEEAVEPSFDQAEQLAAGAIVPALAITPFVVLGLLLAVIQAARLLLPRPPGDHAPLPRVRHATVRPLVLMRPPRNFEQAADGDVREAAE